MKRIRKRLDELTSTILDQACDEETLHGAQEELKALRELINTRKAYNAYVDAFGDDDDVDDDNAPREKRTSNTKFD